MPSAKISSLEDQRLPDEVLEPSQRKSQRGPVRVAIALRAARPVLTEIQRVWQLHRQV